MWEAVASGYCGVSWDNSRYLSAAICFQEPGVHHHLCRHFLFSLPRERGQSAPLSSLEYMELLVF